MRDAGQMPPLFEAITECRGRLDTLLLADTAGNS